MNTATLIRARRARKVSQVTMNPRTADPFLNGAGQAALLGVDPAYLSRHILKAYGPGGRYYTTHPYPTFVDGQYEVVGKSRLVRRSTLREWNKTRPGKGNDGRTGRPRIHDAMPGGLSGAQWQTLVAIAADGTATFRRATIDALVARKLVREYKTGVPVRVTAAGQRLLDEHPESLA